MDAREQRRFPTPVHIHVNPFQVVAVNGKPVAKPIWWNTFALPPSDSTTGQPSTIQIRMRFRSDVTGKTAFHCHILPHEDNGMMSVFELLPGTR
jgi:FtsP/CotA-like multicopper oxidase with cupredoxin domain